MGKKSAKAGAPAPGRQRAGFTAAIGKHASLRVDVEVTSVGLLSIGAVISSILLSTAVIVRSARSGALQTRHRDLRIALPRD